MAGMAISVMICSCSSMGGIKASDPHLVGARDMNYDHLIVPGERIGPARMDGQVAEAVQHLGEPDSVYRSTFRGPGYNADEVYYSYKDECLKFTWMDSGIDPRIESGWRGIIASCDKWATSDGTRVGTPIRDVVARLGEYCATTRSDGTLLVATKQGIWYEAPDRNSAVSRIIVVPVEDNWGGMCKD